MLRVAVDANSLAWGWSGIPKHVDRIARELVEQDVELTLLANSERPFTDIPGAKQAFRRLRGGAVWRNAFVLPWLLRSRPDAFWAPETLTPLWQPVPTVVTVHDLAPVLFPNIKPRRHQLAFRSSIRRAVRRATRVVAVSETTARDLERLWRVERDRVIVVPNGIDDGFRPGDRSAAAAHVNARWDVQGPYLLFVGTFEPRKGLDLLLSIIELATARRLARTFVLVGAAGFQGQEFVARARALGARILEDVSDEDLPFLYRAADTLIAPSLYEGFGLTPLEAMACATPAVVAADGGALEEISGPAAIVVAERTPEAWLAAIDEASKRRNELSERGLRHACAFRWPIVARRLRDVLAEAAGQVSAVAADGGSEVRRDSSATGKSTARARTRP
jgi:glycosyltransferase involved in cell wall biosynthesis